MWLGPQWRLLLGAALISFSPVYVALVDVSSTNSAFWRVAFGGAALLAWVLIKGGYRWPRPRVVAMLIVAAFMFAGDLWFWHQSILYVGPGLSTLLGNFQVFFMTAAGFLLLGQRPTLRQILAIPMALFGLALIVGLDWDGLTREYQLGIIFGLLTALTYAAYMLAFRQAQAWSTAGHSLPVRELAIVSLATMVILGVTAMVEGASLAIPSVKDGAWLVGYALFAHVLGWLFIASSLAHVPAGLIGLSLLLQPLLSFVWDVLIFARPISMLELVGAGIALLAIYFGARAPERAPKQAAAKRPVG
ncbi:MAG: DMT family transporter [Pseudomonadota bacterium]